MNSVKGVSANKRTKLAFSSRVVKTIRERYQRIYSNLSKVRLALHAASVLLVTAIFIFPFSPDSASHSLFSHTNALFAFLGTALLLSVLASLLTNSYKRGRQTARSDRDIRLAVLASICAVTAFGLKLGYVLCSISPGSFHFGYIVLLCIPASAMAIDVLLSAQAAMASSAIMCLLSAILLDADPSFCLIAFASSLAAAPYVSNLKGRSDMARSAAVLAAVNAVLVFFRDIAVGASWREIGEGTAYGVGMALMSIALFLIVGVVIEKLSGLTTHLGLLELSDLNRPLLREFCERCPGTFAHSISVGNLASAAAEEIGADSLLCRVGSYYHDIGKMTRAEFFVENQNGDNVHERMNPSLSALVVAAHVKDGLEIALRAKLPPAICDLIVQHHGTSLIRYFYHRASETLDVCDLTAALEHQFRYPGPKPQTKEAAIMMLADTIEAASHVLNRPTPSRVDELIEKMIAEKLADGQLDEAPITLRDLVAIKLSFAKILTGMMHSRVEYPQLPVVKGSVQSGKLSHDQNSNPPGTVLGQSAESISFRAGVGEFAEVTPSAAENGGSR
jgi:putative nucleotidyltransferase with HDIG domain